MTAQLERELVNIKNKLFSHAVHGLHNYYSHNSILRRYCSFELDKIKKERQWFLDNSVLNSCKYEERNALQSQFVEQVLGKVLTAIQKDHLLDHYEDVITTHHIIKCYEALDQKITQEYKKVQRVARHKRFDHWKGAATIVAGEGEYRESESLDLSADQHQLLVTSSLGDADIVLILDNPNPLVWLINELRDIGLMVNKHRFYYEIVQAAKHALAENPDVADSHQSLLLICLNKAKDMHSEALKYLLDTLGEFKDICQKHDRKTVVSGCLPSLKQRLMADISKFNIQVIKYEPLSQYQEIIMTHEANQAIPLMEEYLKLCGIPFSKPAGPSIQISDKEAKEVELLIQEYKLAEYYSLEYELNRVNWIYFSRKVISLYNAGKHDAGWWLVIQLSDTDKVDLRHFFESYSPIDEENTYQVSFKTSVAVDKQIDEINEYKKQW